ncbi:MAG: c-type cytochrome, partial [Anaerolineae bacterium]
MKSKLFVAAGLLLLLLGLFVGVAGAQDDAVIQGGLLYDKWWKVVGADEPTTDHPLWATQSTNTRSGADTWRCKECHGWDYKGKDGAYGSGSHFTGFPGVFDARTKSVDEIVAALKGGSNSDHDFSTVMDDAALNNLAVFIQNVLDQSQYIDYATKSPIGGDAANGQVLFADNCALCHGEDGTDLNFHTPDDPEYVGTVAAGNPQEFLHKAHYGQPGSTPRMIAGLEKGWTTDQIVDVLAFVRTLPTGAAEEPATLPVSGGVLPDPSLLLL